MKRKSILFSIFGFLTAGLLTIPLLFSSAKIIQTKAAEDDSGTGDSPSTQEYGNISMDSESLFSYFGMPVCEVTINSDNITASPNILVNNEIADPSYVYHIKMAGGISQVNRFPSTNFQIDDPRDPRLYIVLDNVNAVSGDWAPILSLNNQQFNRTLEVNWYLEGTNTIKGHNWNAIVCRRTGNVNLRFSTINSGSLFASDRYGNCAPCDGNGSLDLSFDNHTTVTSVSNQTDEYSMPDENQKAEILLNSFSKKDFEFSLEREPGTSYEPVVGASTEHCFNSEEHTYNEPVAYEWNMDEETGAYTECNAYVICSVCQKKHYEKGVLITTDTATCEEEGIKTTRAEFLTFPPDEKVESSPAKGHDYQMRDGYPATCSSTGILDHYYCFECNKYFTCDANPEETTYEDLIIPINVEHSLENGSIHHHDAECNCDHDGNIEYWTCDLCGKYFLSDGTDMLIEVSLEDIILPQDPSQHNMTFIPGTSPTCEEPGIKDHYYCENCHNNFLGDPENEDYVKATSEDLQIPALGHTYLSSAYYWNANTSGGYNCVGINICNREGCEHEEREDGIVTSNLVKEPSFTEEGLVIYTATFTNPLFATQTKEVTIPVLDKEAYSVHYDWNFDTSTPTCTGVAINMENPEITFTEEAVITSEVTLEPGCTTDGEITYTATFSIGVFDTQTNTQTIDPHGHVMDWIYDKYPTAKADGLKHWGCTICDYREGEDVVIPALDPTDPVAEQEAKESAKDIISPTTEEEKAVVEEALDKIPTETIFEITEVTSTAKNDLNEQVKSGEITQEVYEERVEIVQSITKSAVVIGADQEEAVEAGQTVTELIPEGTGLDMGSIFDEFYARQMSYLLGEDTPDSVIRRVKRAGGVSTPNYNIPAEDYDKIPEFVETSVEHMTEAVLDLRECSGEKLKQDVKNYVTKVQYSSFRDFDKEAADNEFVENAYNAIMLNMQSQVIASLQEELDTLKGNSLASDPARERLLNEQIEAVNDMEQFEIMVLEVLRQKYVSLISEEITLEDFEPIYRGIFRAWALDEESGVSITLKELTESVIDTSNSKAHLEVSTNITKSEIILFATLGGTIVLAGVGFAIYGAISKKRRAR